MNMSTCLFKSLSFNLLYSSNSQAVTNPYMYGGLLLISLGLPIEMLEMCVHRR